MIEIKAPKKHDRYRNRKVFLAGSIEMGKAKPWRHRVAERLVGEEVVLLNPRRDDWDNTWEQDIKHVQFKEQVDWELDGIEEAALIVFYFDPETFSPITLLELGYCLGLDTEMIVCCPPGFYRKGNVDIICGRHKVIVHDTFAQFLLHIVQVVRAG